MKKAFSIMHLEQTTQKVIDNSNKKKFFQWKELRADMKKIYLIIKFSFIIPSSASSTSSADSGVSSDEPQVSQ